MKKIRLMTVGAAGIAGAQLLAAGSGAALAGDVAAASKIEAVTLFPSGAEVTRTVKLKLEAGEHAVIVSDVPGGADPASIRVEGKATEKLDIGSVDARKISLSSADPAVALSGRRKIEERIEKLRDERSGQDDVIKAGEAQKGYLENLQKLPLAAPGGAGAAPRDDWNSVFATIGSRMIEAGKSIAEARVKQRELDRAIADAERELAALGGEARERTELRVNVAAGAALEATLLVRYQVSSASWTPFYDARLSTGDKDKGAAPRLSLARHADIVQSTGEDWDDVSLALATTRPGGGTAAPELNMLRVDFATALLQTQQGGAGADSNFGGQPDQRRAMNQHYSFDQPAAEKPAERTGGEQEIDETPAEASVADFQTMYAIPGKVTVKGAGQSKRLLIASEEANPSLLVRAVPRLDRTAYLYAKLTVGKGSSPVLPGKVSLNRDGVFVGWGRFPQLAPGEDFELGFGADDRVKVKRAAVEDKTGEAGKSKSSHFENRTYLIAVKNLHARPIDVQVLDRAPVSMHKDIKVEFSVTKGPQPTKKDVSDRRGVFMWQFTADPGQEQQFGFNYKVTAPADRPIRYGDLTDEQYLKGQMFRFGAATRF